MKNVPIFDGHNDTLYELFENFSNPTKTFLEGSTKLDLDIPKALKGAFIGGLFSLFAPPPPGSDESKPRHGLTIREDGYVMKMHSPIDTLYADETTKGLIDVAYALEKSLPTKFKIAKSYEDVKTAIKDQKVAAVMHIEGAACIKEDLSNLAEYYELGVRSIGPVWSRPNKFGMGVHFEAPASPDIGPGLTLAGKQLVKECNGLGILVDLAHINEKGFWDAARITTKPIVVSHAGIHKICPSTRNITDKQLDAIGETGGLIGIILEPINTRPDYKRNADTSLDVLVSHFRHVTDRIGVDHVAIGSDFDGAQTYNDLKHAGMLQNLIRALYKSGFTNEEIEKIACENWLRVLKDTLAD